MHHYSVSEQYDREDGAMTTDINKILESPRISDKVNRFLTAYLRGGSIQYAAGVVNVSYRTALAWMSAPAIQEHCEALERAMHENAANQLERATTVAIDTLVHIMLQEQNTVGVNHDTHVTIKACKALLDHYNLQQQNDALRGQVRELERELKEAREQEPVYKPALRIVL